MATAGVMDTLATWDIVWNPAHEFKDYMAKKLLPTLFLLMPIAGFSYTRGTPKAFTRSDLDRAVTRDFCPECGTHMVTRPVGLPAVVLKVGTLDDPALFGNPQMAIYTIDKQTFHQIPEGLPTFERLPKR